MNRLRQYLIDLGPNNARRAAALSALTGVTVSAATIQRLMNPNPARLPRQIRQVYNPIILDLMRQDAEDYYTPPQKQI